MRRSMGAIRRDNSSPQRAAGSVRAVARRADLNRFHGPTFVRLAAPCALPGLRAHLKLSQSSAYAEQAARRQSYRSIGVMTGQRRLVAGQWRRLVAGQRRRLAAGLGCEGRQVDEQSTDNDAAKHAKRRREQRQRVALWVVELSIEG